MTVRIWIPGKFPGLNDYIAAERTNRYIAAGMKKKYQTLAAAHIMQQVRGVEFSRPVAMGYIWHEENRKRDKSNIAAFGRKVIEDALVACGVLKNDGWANIDSFYDAFVVDKGKPGVELLISEVVE